MHLFPFSIASLALAVQLPAATVNLSSTWGEYDRDEAVNGAPGKLTLSAQSNTGFTAGIGENTLDVDGNTGIDQNGRPRIYQTFGAQTLATIGAKVTLSFNLKLGTLFTVAGDTQFRFGLADTLHNQAVLGMIDIGNPAGDAVRLRPDISITGTNTVLASHIPGDWSDFGNTGSAPGAVAPAFQLGGTVGNTASLPNGIGLQDLTTTHLFQMNLERVTGGIQWSVAWSNDAGPGVVTTTSSVVDDSLLPMNSVDGLGFVYIQNNPYGAGNSGTTVISNVLVDGIAVPEPASTGLLALGMVFAATRRRR